MSRPNLKSKAEMGEGGVGTVIAREGCQPLASRTVLPPAKQRVALLPQGGRKGLLMDLGVQTAVGELVRKTGEEKQQNHMGWKCSARILS